MVLNQAVTPVLNQTVIARRWRLRCHVTLFQLPLRVSLPRHQPASTGRSARPDPNSLITGASYTAATPHRQCSFAAGDTIPATDGLCPSSASIVVNVVVVAVKATPLRSRPRSSLDSHHHHAQTRPVRGRARPEDRNPPVTRPEGGQRDPFPAEALAVGGNQPCLWQPVQAQIGRYPLHMRQFTLTLAGHPPALDPLSVAATPVDRLSAGS